VTWRAVREAPGAKGDPGARLPDIYTNLYTRGGLRAGKPDLGRIPGGPRIDPRPPGCLYSGRLPPWPLWRAGAPVQVRDTMSSDQSSDDGAVNSPWGGPSKRGRRLRERHDYGADLFRAALERIDDPGRLRHALLELARTYNPVTNAPLLAAEARHRILELAGQGVPDEARRVLEGALASYLQAGQPPRGPGES
jgi:hypothetical protein